MTWISGSPPEADEDRYVWLLLRDQGGYPFVAVGWLYCRFGDDFQQRHSEWLAWMRDGQQGPRPPEPTLIPWLRVPGLEADNRLDHWRNIDGYMELPKPHPPTPVRP